MQFLNDLKIFWYEVIPEKARETIALGCEYFWGVMKIFLTCGAAAAWIFLLKFTLESYPWGLCGLIPVTIFIACLISARGSVKDER